MLRPITWLILLAQAAAVHAQVNAYAEVTSISGNLLTLGPVSEVYGGFEDGTEAILMQMQTNVIGANTSNGASFGNLAALQTAGRWEVVTIASHTESANVPTTVTVAAPPGAAFLFNTNARVQLISFPQLGTPDFTTTEPITAMPWNGILGGVVAFQVTGRLVVAHDISANGAGFRGGAPSLNNTLACNTTNYTTSDANYAEKGEGIQRQSSATTRYARGKYANGGGGGNPRRAGGGGGGHWTVGGNGGGGFTCTGSGIGGIALGAYVYNNRFFMGGGGGGGQQAFGIGGTGGSGGGIVIVKAQELSTEAPCVPVRISADGSHGGSSIGPIPDGCGGGGAGGSVLLWVNLVTVDSAACPMACTANGGNGGHMVCTSPTVTTNPNGTTTITWPTWGGGGGGGAQGAVMCMGFGGGAIAAGTSPGQGGAHDANGGFAGHAPGPANAGAHGFGGPWGLPVTLLGFSAESERDHVLLEWATGSEQDCERFDVERSSDAEHWLFIGSVAGAGTSIARREYALRDPYPMHGLNYYRLVQVDHDGSRSGHGPVAIAWGVGDLVVAPQPAHDLVRLLTDAFSGAYSVLSADGRIVMHGMLDASGATLIDASAWPSGTYMVHVRCDDGTERHARLHVAR